MKQALYILACVGSILFTTPFAHSKKSHKAHHHNNNANIIFTAKETATTLKQARLVPPVIEPLATLLDNAQALINSALETEDHDLAKTITTLKHLHATIKTTYKKSIHAYDTAKKASATIKPLSYNQAEKILTEIITALKEQSPLPAREITTLNALLASIEKQDKAQTAATKKAAKSYVLISNALGLGGIKGRLAIWGALKSKPTTMIRMHGLTIKKNEHVKKISCNPLFVYYIKLVAADGHEHLLNRVGRKTHYFSDADAHHQIIVNGTHRYGVHTIKYKGPGSMYSVKISEGAILAAQQIGITLATMGATGLFLGVGEAGIDALEALGIDEEVAASYGIRDVTDLGIDLANAINKCSTTLTEGLDTLTGGASTSFAKAIAEVTEEASAGLRSMTTKVSTLFGKSAVVAPLDSATTTVALSESQQTVAAMTRAEAERIATDAELTGAEHSIGSYSAAEIGALTPENAAILAPYMTEEQLAALNPEAAQEILNQKTAAEAAAKKIRAQQAYNNSTLGKALNTSSKIGNQQLGTIISPDVYINTAQGAGRIFNTARTSQSAAENASAQAAAKKAILKTSQKVAKKEITKVASEKSAEGDAEVKSEEDLKKQTAQNRIASTAENSDTFTSSSSPSEPIITNN